MRKTRPGGRTAQTRSAVFSAVGSLLAEKSPADISMTEIAERAGVAATSLYRRWGDVRTLMTEVAVERLMQVAPLPDTGTLRGDLVTWARSVAASLDAPGGSAFFRVYVGAAPRSREEGLQRVQAMSGRLQQIAEMLERAEARGEAAPSVTEVADHVLAPLYMRALFGVPPSAEAAEGFVDFLVGAMARRG